jgi:hypothetical protein
MRTRGGAFERRWSGSAWYSRNSGIRSMSRATSSAGANRRESLHAPRLLLPRACAPEAASLPDDLQAPPASVILEGPDRLFVGRANTFVVSGNLGQQEPAW